MKERKPVRKLYRITPINKELERLYRVIWVHDNQGIKLEDMDINLPYRSKGMLLAYMHGLEQARTLMKVIDDKKKDIEVVSQ